MNFNNLIYFIFINWLINNNLNFNQIFFSIFYNQQFFQFLKNNYHSFGIEKIIYIYIYFKY